MQSLLDGVTIHSNILTASLLEVLYAWEVRRAVMSDKASQ